ncbi:DUF4192 domain-containing protein [Actinomadura hibisca]|uniref:DUF4192 domain-containing protein n=1 Tax=Actinomadura hibisca TaxID=68565 RepID=UPI000AEFBAA2|nr:DUF4192 domain-containing protein [Actinomadura hibisca]
MVIGDPQDAIAAVPFMLGFHPTDSLVVLASGGPRETCALRHDLPVTDDHVAAVLAGNGFLGAIVLGYGPADLVVPSARLIREALTAHGIEVLAAVRVDGGRWWSLTCPQEECCPPSGHTYDITSSRLTAEAVYRGEVILPDREALARSVAPLDRPPHEAMARAEERFFNSAREGPRSQTSSRTNQEGIALLDALLIRAQEGGPFPDDDELANLAVHLTSLTVRDAAWSHTQEGDPLFAITFWRHILQRVDEPYASAPACLLAFAAYSAGDGGLANVALDRAEPGYTMAILLREVMYAGIPPSELHIHLLPTRPKAGRTTRPRVPKPRPKAS